MNDDQFKVLLERLDNIERIVRGSRNEVAEIDKGMEIDNRGRQEFILRLGAMESRVEVMQESINNLPRDISRGVSKVTVPVTEAVTDMTETIEKKRTMLVTGLTWWEKIKKTLPWGKGK